MKTIVIVGGGPAALAISSRLLEELRDHSESLENIEIVIYEKGDKIGVGLPYAQSEDCYILNLPVEKMRVDFYNQNGFLEWFTTHFPNLTMQFPPRKYFGLYLAYMSEYIKKQGEQQSVSVRYFTKTGVTEIERAENSKYRVTTDKGVKTADYIVLCTGHMPNKHYEELKDYPNYIHDQWQINAFDDLQPNETVGIIGSRLSAIDIAMKLRERNHAGKIRMFSRSGLLPTVLATEIPSYSLKYLTMNNLDFLMKDGIKHLPLDGLVDLFWQEISEAEGRDVSFNTICKSSADMSPLEWLGEEIKQAEKGSRPWQQVMFAIYPIVPLIWRSLSFSDKKRFMRDYYSLYMSYLVAFPLDNARKVYEMLSEGQLEVIGGLKEVSHRNQSFAITSEFEEYLCDRLFNATGPGYDPQVLPLYQQMLEKGIVTKDRFGGLSVNPRTLQVINRYCNEEQNIYAVGELTRGTCLATTDMTQLSRQADRIGLHLSASIKNRRGNISANFMSHVGFYTKNFTPSISMRSVSQLFARMPQNATTKFSFFMGGLVCGGAYVASKYLPLKPK